MFETIEPMVATLQKSVEAIMNSDADNRGDLLAKTFSQFSAAAQGELEKQDNALADDLLGKLESEGALDVPLFKGMGAVGMIANLVSSITDKVHCIQEGLDYVGQKEPGERSDPASAEVSEMLDHLVAMAELTLRAAVNEHVDPLGEDEDPDNLGEGMHLVIIPHADYPDSAEHAIVAKSWLPDELRKFATDPEMLAEGALTTGAAMFELGGVSSESLSKFFGNDGLAKAVPGQNDPNAGAGGAMGGGSGDGTGDGSGDGTGDGGGALPDQSNEDPLEVLGRILALALVQLDHIRQMVEGTNEPIDGSTATDEGNDGSMPQGDGSGAGAGQPANKAVENGGLAKVESAEQVMNALNKLDPAVGGAVREALGKAMQIGAEKEQLEKRFNDMEKMVRDLLAQPTTPKGNIAEVPVALAKSQDGAGAAAASTSQSEDMRKRDPDEAAVDKIKQIMQKSS